MNRWLMDWLGIFILCVAIVIGVLFALKQLPCYGSQCWNIVCYSQMDCGPNCYCLTRAMENQGECVH